MRRGRRILEELDRDIREHIERETQDNIERGMTPEEARYAAVRKFGNVMRVKEDTRDVWRIAGSRNCGKTSATACACCVILRASPLLLFLRSRWELAPTQPF